MGIFYRKPEDWLDWSMAFKKLANCSRILQYIQRIRPWPIKPKYPDPRDYEQKPRDPPHAPPEQPRPLSNRRGRGRTTDSQVPSRAVQTRHHHPDVDDRSDSLETNHIVTDSNLTPDGMLNYNDAINQYKAQEKIWDTTSEAQRELKQWVLSTVSKDMLFHLEHRDLEQIYKSLEDRSVPHIAAIADQIRDDYDRLRESIWKYEKKMGEWIDKWEKVLCLAEKYKLIDITTPSAWCYHLRCTIGSLPGGQSWVLGEYAMKESEILTGKLTYNEIAAILQMRLGRGSGRTGDRVNDDFLALGGSSSDEYEERRERDRDSSSGKSRRSKRRGRNNPHSQDQRDQKRRRPNNYNNRDLICELCQREGHKLDSCWFTYNKGDSAFPDHFDPSDVKQSSTARLVARVRRLDPMLDNKVKEIQKNRSRH